MNFAGFCCELCYEFFQNRFHYQDILDNYHCNQDSDNDTSLFATVEAVALWCPIRKMSLIILQNLQKNPVSEFFKKIAD